MYRICVTLLATVNHYEPLLDKVTERRGKERFDQNALRRNFNERIEAKRRDPDHVFVRYISLVNYCT